MTKPLTIGLAFAAMIAGALALDTFDKAPPPSAAIVTEAAAAESEPKPVLVRMAQLAVTQPYMFDYERGPRIIHVPQPGDRVAGRPAARASIERRPPPAAIEEDDDEDDVIEAAPPPRPRAVVPPKPRVAATPPQPPAAITPRWKLRSESPPPPPPGPRRAILSAPPPSADGPTPLRPTPRFDAKRFDTKTENGQKFAAPVEPVSPAPMVSESQPPLGYSPPATPAATAVTATPPEETQAVPAESAPAE